MLNVAGTQACCQLETWSFSDVWSLEFGVSAVRRRLPPQNRREILLDQIVVEGTQFLEIRALGALGV